MKRVIRCGDSKLGQVEFHRTSKSERKRHPDEDPFFIMVRDEYGNIVAVGLTLNQLGELRAKAEFFYYLEAGSSQTPGGEL